MLHCGWSGINIACGLYLRLGITIVLVFICKSSYCFQRILAIAILSVRLSIRLFITRVDESKMVQAKSLPSTAWKTLVSGTVKLFHKFEGGHPERGR